MTPSDASDVLERMPDKCFIFHAYHRCKELNVLRQRLPARVSLIYFPPITVTPEERVSDDLVRAVLACPGLIYVSSHFSESFWVEFEREIALRNKRVVFEFDLATDRIEVCEAEPRDVRVTAVFAPADRSQVLGVSQWLQKERNFQIDTAHDYARIDDHDLEIPQSDWSYEFITKVHVFFLSRAALEDRHVTEALRTVLKAPWQMLVVRLEELSEREIVRSLMRPIRNHDFIDKAYQSILDRSHLIDVFDNWMVGDQINWNRADDLMVRIFYQMNPARLLVERRVLSKDAEYLRGIPADWLRE